MLGLIFIDGGPPCTWPRTYLKFFNFIHIHAKNENILPAHFFRHFYIGTVHSSDGESAVQLETKQFNLFMYNYFKFEICASFSLIFFHYTYYD